MHIHRNVIGLLMIIMIVAATLLHVGVSVASERTTIEAGATQTEPIPADLVPLLTKYECPDDIESKGENKSGAVDFVLIMDTSGSMTGNDAPDKPSVERRIVAAKLFVDLLLPSERVSVVKFGRQAEVLAPFGNDKTQLKDAIDLADNNHIIPGTRTDTSHGLAAALCALLNRTTDIDNRAVVVLLTDGQPDPSAGTKESELALVDSLVQQFSANKWSIWTIGLCSYKDGLRCGPDLLSRIAEETGGVAKIAKEPRDLVDAYIGALADVYGYRTITQTLTIADEHEFFVPPQTRQLIAVSKGQIGVEPRSDAAAQGQAECQPAEEFYVCRVNVPIVGAWRVIALADEVELTQLLAEVAFGVNLVVKNGPPYVVDGPPAQFEAHLVDENGAIVEDEQTLNYLDSQMAVQIQRPDGTTERIELARSGPGQSVFAGSYQCTVAGEHIASPTQGEFIQQREDVNFVCETPTPTPIPTDTPTLTPTPTDTPTPTPYPVEFLSPHSPYRVPTNSGEYGLEIEVQVVREVSQEESFRIRLTNSTGDLLDTLPLAVQSGQILHVELPPDVCSLLQELGAGEPQWDIVDNRFAWSGDIGLQVVRETSAQGVVEPLATPYPVKLEAEPRIADLGYTDGTPPAELQSGHSYPVQVKLLCNEIPINLPADDRVQLSGVIRYQDREGIATVAPLQPTRESGRYEGRFQLDDPGAYRVQAELWVNETPQAVQPLWDAILPNPTPTFTPTPTYTPTHTPTPTATAFSVAFEQPQSPYRVPSLPDQSYALPVSVLITRPESVMDLFRLELLNKAGEVIQVLPLAVEEGNRMLVMDAPDVCEILAEAGEDWRIIDGRLVWAGDVRLQVHQVAANRSPTPTPIGTPRSLGAPYSVKLEAEPMIIWTYGDVATPPAILRKDRPYDIEVNLMCGGQSIELAAIPGGRSARMVGVLRSRGDTVVETVPLTYDASSEKYGGRFWVDVPGDFKIQAELWVNGTPQLVERLWEASLPMDTPTPPPPPTPTSTPVVQLEMPTNPYHLPSVADSENSYQLPIAGRTAIRPADGQSFFVAVGEQVRQEAAIQNGRFDAQIDACPDLFAAWAAQDPDKVWRVVGGKPLLVSDYSLDFYVGDVMAEALPNPRYSFNGYELEAEPTLAFDIPTDSGDWENLWVYEPIEVTAHIECNETIMPFADASIASGFQVVAVVIDPNKVALLPVALSPSAEDRRIYVGSWTPTVSGEHTVEIQLRAVGSEEPVLKSRPLYFPVEK